MYQVSVLVPVYGVHRFIERCARSLFEQTYDNLEYIFVDDCSPDNSIAILKRVMEDYPERESHVRIICHERNRGLAAARNTALDAANGPFVTHVDSDDYLDRDAIRLLVKKQEGTGADIVSGNYYEVWSSGIKKVSEPPCNDQYEMLLQEISCSKTHYIWRRLINSRLYNDYHIRVKENVNFMEDWQQIAILAYYAKGVARIDEHIYYYDCTNSSSYISNFPRNKELWNQAIESARIVEGFYTNKDPEYKIITHRATSRILKHQLSAAARFQEKLFFEEVKSKITTEYADCYSEIGWNLPLVRLFMCNYTLNSIYRRTLDKINVFSHY